MHIYHVFIDILSAYMIHNTIFYTHVAQSPKSKVLFDAPGAPIIHINLKTIIWKHVAQSPKY